jgi:tetratricopeptide (TPR) repeat protein
MRQFNLSVLAILALLASACATSVPDRSSADYERAVRSFYVGLAALQVGDDRRAREELYAAVKLADGEPAAWNNLGVLHLRHREFGESLKALERARTLAPDLALLYSNLAILADQRGEPSKAVENLKRAIELEPLNPRSVTLLAQEMERQTNDEEALRLYLRVAELLPKNLAVSIETARLAAKLGKTDEARNGIDKIGTFSGEFSPEAKEQFVLLKNYAESGEYRQAANQISFFRNVLLREAWFRNAIAEFRPSETTIGELIDRPIKIPSPEFKPAEPDTTLRFDVDPIGDGTARFAKPFYLNGDDPPVVAWANEKELRIGDLSLPVRPENENRIAAFDFDYDFRNDLAVAATDGFRLFRQIEDGSFADRTAATNLSAELLRREYIGVWPLDFEHDGDLDLLLAPKSGSPIVLQNNGDGTFTAFETFETARNIKDFIYVDLDEDGDADAAFLLADGTMAIFTNERGGIFKAVDEIEIDSVDAMTVSDAGGAGRLEILTLKAGKVERIRFEPGSINARIETIASIENLPCEGNCSIFAADLDNNGASDLIVANDRSFRILLGTAAGGYINAAALSDGSIAGFSDLTANGRIDLVGRSADGLAAVFRNSGEKDHHWQILRPRAAKTVGDQRVNSFGIGGEIEIRTGTNLQKRLIDAPQVHFGLGESNATDVLRVVWGNGFVQAEFDLASDETIAAEQRLKGSCPHLFTWNGEKFVLVKDAPPWSPALGLKINAQDTYGILQTEEWFKIPGEQLKPLGGNYELRITGEYWESFYLDNYQLIVVDHPDNTEVFTDERFAIPLPPLKVFTTEQRRPFDSVTDHNGRDVADVVLDLDENYLDGFKRGRFQGVAEDHWVEFSVPEPAAPDQKLLLIADGWVHPTDASINVQLGQSSHSPPKSLSLEVPAEDGGWKAVKEDLGFPAGKLKTVLIELPAGEQRFRLRTNMEIFWDRLAWAVEISGIENRETRLDLVSAELSYRGFSVIEKADDSSPEKPDYDRILTTAQRWRDLEGYYTRFGEITELLTAVDDRVVLMNAGDELVLRFPVLPDPKPGWKRDYVIVGNGWIKDGDLNSVFSRTLLPLPTQASNDYTRRPTRLEDDPVFRRNSVDWLNFHTRYVAPDGFRRALNR